MKGNLHQFDIRAAARKYGSWPGKRILIAAAAAVVLVIVMTAPKNMDNGLMTLKDVYALSRKGEALTLRDFEPFFYRLAGSDIAVRRYDVTSADTVFVRVEDGKLESARLMSRRTLDPSKAIDLQEGFEAVAEYMNPLGSFWKNNFQVYYGYRRTDPIP
jgi:hypothetical protein